MSEELQKTITIRLNEKEAMMLEELKKIRGPQAGADVVRLLICEEYQRIGGPAK